MAVPRRSPAVTLPLIAIAATLVVCGCDGGGTSGQNGAGAQAAGGDTGEGPCPDAGHDTGSDATTDAGADAGVPRQDGGTAAGGPLSLIIPGQGIDYHPDAATTHSLRVMSSDYAAVDGVLGAGTPSPDMKYHLTWAAPPLDVLFVDTNGSKALDAGDFANRIILRDGFRGETTEGHGIGTPRTGWSREAGEPDLSSTLDTGEQIDLFFTRGLNVCYSANGDAQAVTLYRPQRVVPGKPIDWRAMSVLGLTASLNGGSSFQQVDGVLGPTDLVSNATIGKVDTETQSWLSLGLSFTHAANAPGEVNTILVYPPYFGKLTGTNLGLGSTHAEIKAYFDGLHPEKTQTGTDVTIYYYEITQETVAFIYNFNICLGFIYNSKDVVTTILVGYPVQK